MSVDEKRELHHNKLSERGGGGHHCLAAKFQLLIPASKYRNYNIT